MVLVYLVVVQLLVLDVYILYGMKHRETSSVAPLVRAVFCAQPFYLQPKVLCVCELLLTCAGSPGANSIRATVITGDARWCGRQRRQDSAWQFQSPQ
jgi:hypothetical protein